jgi:SAM-dependent methyltransferase
MRQAMGRQETRFRLGEGDAWYERNKDKAETTDPVIEAILPLEGEEDIVEIGSGRGMRIATLAGHTTGSCIGIDPSSKAIAYSSHTYSPYNVWFYEGTALNFPPHDCDILIYGFCLYLCDPEDLSGIVAVGDSTLRDKGLLVIQDFDPDHTHRVAYHHRVGIFSFKMDWSQLWLANPAYTLVNKVTQSDGTAVWVLKKDVLAGWPLENLDEA